MRLSTTSFVLAALLVVPATTLLPAALAGRTRTPEQDAALLQARKTWSKDSYQRRLDLLKSHQRCIDAAASRDALKQCRQQKKQARKSLRKDHRAYMNKVRNQLGLPEKTGKKRDARRRTLQA